MEVLIVVPNEEEVAEICPLEDMKVVVSEVQANTHDEDFENVPSEEDDSVTKEEVMHLSKEEKDEEVKEYVPKLFRESLSLCSSLIF
ncbi:hypothetical protein SUGI_0254370 [Cryptomeria japonica]|nr:hypothetical protein SUGI_0254370 [Cryptomeria japonica]